MRLGSAELFPLFTPYESVGENWNEWIMKVAPHDTVSLRFCPNNLYSVINTKKNYIFNPKTNSIVTN